MTIGLLSLMAAKNDQREYRRANMILARAKKRRGQPYKDRVEHAKFWHSNVMRTVRMLRQCQLNLPL